MSSVSKTILIGNVGQDPEIKTLDGGTRVANLSLATTKTYTDKATGNKVENTEWHSVTAYGPVVDIIEKYVKKGSKIYVEGENQTRKWEKDGHTFQKTEVNLKTLNLL